jgi:dihydrofolate reductase
VSTISLIFAVAQNGVIGRDNQLPWHIPADLRWFKAKTVGKPVVMGRRTFESLGKPLPGRPNLVVSGDPAFAPEGATVHRTLPAALDAAAALAGEGGEIMVLGGARIFAEAFPLAPRVYVTEIPADFEGDFVLPPFDRSAWRETFRERHDGDPPFSFVILERP